MPYGYAINPSLTCRLLPSCQMANGLARLDDKFSLDETQTQTMALNIQYQNLYTNSNLTTTTSTSSPSFSLSISLSTHSITNSPFKTLKKSTNLKIKRSRKSHVSGIISASLDLTEDNIKQVLQDARTEFAQIFDTSVGMTGKAELAEVDGPFVKIRLSGRFWHERSLVIARLGNYLKQKIPEILEVEVEDEKQLDDSPANF